MTAQALRPRGYFWRLFLATPLVSIGVFLFNALYMTLPLAFGLILRAFFDTLSGEAQTGWNIWSLVALYLATRVALQFAEIGAAGSSAYQYSIVNVLLRRNVFRTLLQAAGFRAPYGSGEIVNRFEEDTNAVADPVFIATYGTGLIVSTTVTLWVLLRINTPLTLLAFGATLVSVLLIRLMGSRLEAFHAATREASEKVSGLLAQLLNGVQALQVAGAEDAAVARLDQLGETRRGAAVRDEVLNTFVRSMGDTTVSLTTGLLLIAAASLRQSGGFTVGDLALFVSYVAGGGVVQEIVEWVGRLIRHLKRADVSMTRLAELAPAGEASRLIDTSPPHLHGVLPHSESAQIARVHNETDMLRELKVSGLTYRHAGHGRGVADINLALHRGSFSVITGRIGAGKSVFLQVLLGLLPKEAGEITWNGQAVHEPAKFFTPPRCAYTPQTPRLFSETVRDNILMGLPADPEALADAIYAAVFEADISQLEEGLETVVGPRGMKLSGGQIQRTAAARMFVRSAELLVFDDLSSALDVETEQKLWQRLFARPVRPTCLVVSHRRAALQHADHIIVLKEGRVEDEGALDELLARCDEMKRLWRGEVDL